jgi:NAD(P)-dependent dehydrogenase (short-subunit alcohol dehydrogenase family)
MPTVLITGTNRGLGLELTRQYIDKGWSVIAANRTSSQSLEAYKGSQQFREHLLDLVDDKALEKLAADIEDKSIDVLINNAGTMGRRNFASHGLKAGEFGTFDRREWHQVFDINVCTPMRLAELFVDQVAASKNGRIVTISSMVGSMELNTIGSMYAYRASKAGVNAIMTSMAVNLASRGITAIAMHPGFVRTEMGGAMAEIEPEESAEGMIRVIDGLTTQDSGKFLGWDGNILPW